MNEVCINILRMKLKEMREVATHLNSDLLSDAIREFEEALSAVELIIEEREG